MGFFLLDSCLCWLNLLPFTCRGLRFDFVLNSFWDSSNSPPNASRAAVMRFCFAGCCRMLNGFLSVLNCVVRSFPALMVDRDFRLSRFLWGIIRTHHTTHPTLRRWVFLRWMLPEAQWGIFGFEQSVLIVRGFRPFIRSAAICFLRTRCD